MVTALPGILQHAVKVSCAPFEAWQLSAAARGCVAIDDTSSSDLPVIFMTWALAVLQLYGACIQESRLL
jgi:hypothetical protein